MLPCIWGVAIALRDGGLVAPAIRDCRSIPVEEVMVRLFDLVNRARAGRLRGSETSSPTITVTNLGEQGAEVGYGIVIPPQVALVCFGRIALRPWVVGADVAVRSIVHVTLSADHRVSDGHRGGQFLKSIDHHLQNPENL